MEPGTGPTSNSPKHPETRNAGKLTKGRSIKKAHLEQLRQLGALLLRPLPLLLLLGLHLGQHLLVSKTDYAAAAVRSLQLIIKKTVILLLLLFRLRLGQHLGQCACAGSVGQQV